MKAGKKVKVKPGKHLVKVKRKGFVASVRTVKVKRGKTLTLSVKLKKAQGKKRKAKKAKKKRKKAKADARKRRRAKKRGPKLRPWAMGAWAAGGVSVAVGIGVGIAANGSADDHNASRDYDEKKDLQDDAESLALTSNVFYGIGIAAIATGTVLWFLDSGDSHASVAPLPDGGAIVGVGGRF